MIRPRRLESGALVALVAAAGPMPEGAIERAEGRVRSLGWVPRVGRHAARRSGFLAGTDAERAADLNDAIRDPDIDAVWLLRGGYGTMRILADIDLKSLRDHPKPLIGFSDNTALHLAAFREGVVTFHGPHPAAADLSAFSVEGVRQILTDQPMNAFPLPAGWAPIQSLVGGTAEGTLVGGNLSLLASTVGTPAQIAAEGALLFFEEVGESAYRLDRLLTQLLLSGRLEGVNGILVGAISDQPDSGDPELPSPAEILLERLGPLGVPLAVGFPFGHISDNWTLPVGVRARLDADRGELALLESPTC